MALFSIIIPTYNRAHLISKTIDSILAQSFSDYEIIVIDDKSTDNTAAILQPYINNGTIRYFANEVNSERAISRNRGIDEAKGEFVSLLDSDDIFFPDCLASVAITIKANPDSKFFHCKYCFINEEHKIISYQKYPPENSNPFKELTKGNYISNIGFFLQRDVARKVRYHEDRILTGVEDYDFLIRVLAEVGEVKRINEVGCGVLMHPQRSVFTDDWEFTYKRTMAFMNKQLESSYFKEHYWKYRTILESHLYLYLCAFLAVRKKTMRGGRFLMKAIVARPSILFSGIFWKHLFVVLRSAVR